MTTTNGSVMKSGLSFGFSRTNEKKILNRSVIHDQERDGSKQTKEYLSVISSNDPVKEKEEKLVIPLIQANKWRLTLKPEDLEKDEDTDDAVGKSQSVNVTFKKTGDTATDDAVKEILTDAAHQNDKFVEGSASDSMISIPILLKNKVPGGYETDDKLDVALRPETVADDYEAVPVEAFGLAMLRGMGWKEGDKSIKMKEVRARPKGLGLAADRSVLLQTEELYKNDGKTDDEEKKLTMKTGVHCVIVGGRRNGQFGVVVGIDEDNARVMVKLTLGNETITISQYTVRLVTKKEYDQGHRCINQAKVDQYKKSERETNGTGEEKSVYKTKDSDSCSENDKDKDEVDNQRHKHKDKDSHRHTSKHRDSSHEKNHHGHKHRHKHKHSDGKKEEGKTVQDSSDLLDKHSKERKMEIESNDTKSSLKRSHSDRDNVYDTSVTKKSSSVWLRPYLRVRVIDSKYKNGQYFKSKVVIEDVISTDTCICRTEDGKVLEDIMQDQLETVVPREIPSYVMIVSGKYKSQLAEVLQKDKNNCTALIQLMSDRDKALTLDFDDICEYTGNATSDFNY